MTDDDALSHSEAKQSWVGKLAEHKKVPQAEIIRSNRKPLPRAMAICLERGSAKVPYHNSVGFSKNDSPTLISTRQEILTD